MLHDPQALPHWVKLLKEEAERTSIAACARKIGYSRPAVSLALKGRYPAGTARLERRVMRVLGGFDVA